MANQLDFTHAKIWISKDYPKNIYTKREATVKTNLYTNSPKQRIRTIKKQIIDKLNWKQTLFKLVYNTNQLKRGTHDSHMKKMTMEMHHQASASERVGKSRPWSAGIFSISSLENNGRSHNAFFVPKTLRQHRNIIQWALSH